MSEITKTEVCTGVHWIEIPGAELRVLCGCPADVVKHLIRCGLIRKRAADSVIFETGPNAILLSDVAVQNGCFSNLSEFPVLQMLYRQGMILPGHPGNVGVKPLIIGHPDQVVAQLQYIYRGNYGLVSTNEMVKAGVDEEEAETLMRIKLYFAFGAINSSEQLLDSIFVQDDQFTDIRNGVEIGRVGDNVYEFRYQGESVKVDLNLESGKRYPSPLSLPYLQTDRPYFGVIHSGEGDGWDINRPSMSSILVYQGEFYLIDAGPNLDNMLSKLGISVNEIKGIFHTHCHDDHFAGITTLVQAGKKIKYFATPLVRASIEKKICALLSIEQKRFEELFDVVDLPFDEWTNLDGLEVLPQLSPHPVENNVFTFRALGPEGYKTYCHLADMAAFSVLDAMVEKATDTMGASQEFVDDVKSRYLVPADIKKLDIGGGLIHGTAEDFRADESERIVLAHVARELSESEKEVGSNAPFGVCDSLIESTSDYARRDGFMFLREYFSEVPGFELTMLNNCPISQRSPGTIISKVGETCESVMLVLRGNIERIIPGSRRVTMMSAGSLIGPLAALYESPLEATYRTASFVTTLDIPTVMYREFIQRNDLMGKLEKTSALVPILQRTPLFGEGLDYLTYAKLAEAADRFDAPAGELIPGIDEEHLYVLLQGRVARMLGVRQLSELTPGNIFGGETAIFDFPSAYHYRCDENASLIGIPCDLVKDIPVLRWKLLEIYQNNMRGIYKQ